MTIEQFNTICEHIEGGLSLRKACLEEGFKSGSSFIGFMNSGEDSTTRTKQYARAMEARHDFLFEQILEIADSQEDDVSTLTDGEKVINYNIIQRNRLQVDARKWALSKMNPKKYGDKVDVTSEGEKIQSIPAIHWVKDADGDTDK